jgi:hypothetical protein
MIIKAVRDFDAWVLIEKSTGRVMGEETPYLFKTRKEAYEYCEGAWPLNSVWEGHKVKRGYYIKED